jgi:NAD(P)-dependent dehydrogenase (short-subunit alcohol dehydrogenase family)
MLAKQGAQLVLAGRTPEPVEAVATETGGVALTLDATDIKAVAAAVDRSVAEFSRIDGIANCVGSVLLKPAHITTAPLVAHLPYENQARGRMNGAGRASGRGDRERGSCSRLPAVGLSSSAWRPPEGLEKASSSGTTV